MSFMVGHEKDRVITSKVLLQEAFYLCKKYKIGAM